MKVVGLHRLVMAGIDYVPANYIRENSPSLAVSERAFTMDVWDEAESLL